MVGPIQTRLGNCSCLQLPASLSEFPFLLIQALLQLPFLLGVTESMLVCQINGFYSCLFGCWFAGDRKLEEACILGVQKENVRLSCKLMAKCFFSSQKIEWCKEWEWSRGELLADFLGGWKCPLTALGRANNSTRVSTWDLQVEGTFQKYLCAPSGCLCSPVATFVFCEHLWCRREGRTSTEDVVWLWSAFIVLIVFFASHTGTNTPQDLCELPNAF